MTEEFMQKVAIGALGAWSALQQYLHLDNRQSIREAHRRIEDRVPYDQYRADLERLYTSMQEGRNEIMGELRALRQNVQDKADR